MAFDISDGYRDAVSGDVNFWVAVIGGEVAGIVGFRPRSEANKRSRTRQQGRAVAAVPSMIRWFGRVPSNRWTGRASPVSVWDGLGLRRICFFCLH